MLTGCRRTQAQGGGIGEGPFLARRRPTVAALGASSVLIVAAAACGGGTSSSTASTSATTQPPASRSSASSSSPRQVMTQLTEFKIGVSQSSFAPGTYTFVATNNGKAVHALEIDGPGVEDQKTAMVQPGQSANLTVNLQKGTYQVYCPVDGHKSLGMATNITVS